MLGILFGFMLFKVGIGLFEAFFGVRHCDRLLVRYYDALLQSGTQPHAGTDLQQISNSVE
jgi:hypothetical protein